MAAVCETFQATPSAARVELGLGPLSPPRRALETRIVMEAMRASHLFDSYRRAETGQKTAGWSDADIAFHKELLMLAQEED